MTNPNDGFRGEDVHYEEGVDSHAKKEASEETADLDITSHQEHVPVRDFEPERVKIMECRNLADPVLSLVCL